MKQEEFYKHLKEFKGLSDTKKLIDISIEEDQLLVTIIDLISAILNVKRISLMLYNEEKDELILKAGKGLSGVKIGATKKVGNDISSWVLKNKDSLLINDIKKDVRFKESQFSDQFSTTSLISIPLILDNSPIGVLNINNKFSGEGFNDADLKLLESFTKQISLAISNILSYYEKIYLYEDILKARSLTQTIIEGIPDGLIAIDEKENIIAFNMVAERITTLNKNDIINNYFKRYEELGFVDNLIKSILTKGNTDTDNIKYTNPKGESFILRAKTALLKDYEQNRTGTLILFTDVTKFKVIAEKLRQSKNLILLGEAARNIGHEIGNKISGLDMFSELLIQEIPNDDKRRTYADELKEGINELMAFLKRFKEVYRNIKILPSQININSVINKILKRNAGLIKGKGILIENKHGAIPVIEGDETYLESALLNIILNAIEAMDNGGKLTISTAKIEQPAESAVVEINISDTGGGISQEDIEKVFIPCYTTKASGSGLGLTITQKIIEAHNGTIKVNSKINEGTTFIIYLPFKQEGS
ncbi:MAG: ATP-binding protein [Nitrospirota bacterium]